MNTIGLGTYMVYEWKFKYSTVMEIQIILKNL